MNEIISLEIIKQFVVPILGIRNLEDNKFDITTKIPKKVGAKENCCLDICNKLKIKGV